MTLDYAQANHARHGRFAESAGLLAQAATQTAHAVPAARGEWTTNDKTLLTRAGLSEIDQIIANTSPHHLIDAVEQTRRLLATSMRVATA